MLGTRRQRGLDLPQHLRVERVGGLQFGIRVGKCKPAFVTRIKPAGQRAQRAEHRRNTALADGAADVVQPGQVLPRHLLVEKQQGTEGLAVGGRRHLALVRQHGQKGLDLGLAQLARMPQPVKADEPARPVQIGLFRAQAVVQIADALSHLVQQAPGLQGRAAERSAGFGGCVNTVHKNSIMIIANKIKASGASTTPC